MWLFILLIVAHWFGDFICQNQWMAENKSKDPEALTVHVFVYSFILFITLLITGQFLLIDISRFVLLNFIIHWIIDLCTSKANKYALEEKKDMHLFFSIVGLDQICHIITLIITSELLLKRLI